MKHVPFCSEVLEDSYLEYKLASSDQSDQLAKRKEKFAAHAEQFRQHARKVARGRGAITRVVHDVMCTGICLDPTLPIHV